VPNRKFLQKNAIPIVRPSHEGSWRNVSFLCSAYNLVSLVSLANGYRPSFFRVMFVSISTVVIFFEYEIVTYFNSIQFYRIQFKIHGSIYWLVFQKEGKNSEENVK
jgi:hypothetical protein